MEPLIIHLNPASNELCAAMPNHARNYKPAIQELLYSAACNQPVPTLAFEDITPAAIPYIATMVDYYKLDIYISCSITKQNAATVRVASLLLKIPELTKLVIAVEEGFASSAINDGQQLK